MFLFFHALRVIFPLTLMSQIYSSTKLYLSIMGPYLTPMQRCKTISMTVCVLCIMTISLIWFNFVI